MRGLFLGLSFFSSVTVFGSAELVSCTAKVALNRVFQVEVNRASREVKVVTDNGYRYEGSASFAFSPRSNSETYYLALQPPLSGSGFTGIGVELELGGAKRIALCLKSNECYLCK